MKDNVCPSALCKKVKHELDRLEWRDICTKNFFQSVMDQRLNGIPGVQCYLDDILCVLKV